MNSRQIVILASMLAVAINVCAQRTTRQRLKIMPEPVLAEELSYDTVAVAADGLISFFGYEKVLRSTAESFMVRNGCRDSLTCLDIKIDYKDIKGNILHTRTERVEVVLAPDETRKVDLRSWDKQKVFYYYRSPKPKTSQATPYKVDISLVAALKNKK